MNTNVNFELVKESIVKASKEVFRRYGYTKVSMDDISKASGKGRSTIYHYFKNKKELFEALAISEFTRIIRQAKDKVSPEAALPENFLRYSLTKLQGLKALMMEYETILQDLREHPELITQLNRLLLLDESEVIENIFSMGLVKGEIAKLNQEELNFLVETLVIAFRSFEQEIILNDGLAGLEKRMEWLIHILLKGLK